MDLAARLQRELRVEAGEVGDFPSPAAVLAVATQHFLDGQRIDMQVLAAETGVARATLYRWFGDRERLIGQVLWVLSRQALEWFAVQERPDEIEHVFSSVEAFMRVTSAFEPLRRFLAAEPALALRALLEPDAPLVVSLNEWATDRLTAAGIGKPPGPSPRELAEVLVSVTSTYCWARVIAGGEADVDSAMRAVRTLLR
jgi:AcrR family transcriptional regulator